MLDENTRLVDSRNKSGETPLMRAMVNSVPTVVKVWAGDE
jgi:ankyrin repeat protein